MWLGRLSAMLIMVGLVLATVGLVIPWNLGLFLGTATTISGCIGLFKADVDGGPRWD